MARSIVRTSVPSSPVQTSALPSPGEWSAPLTVEQERQLGWFIVNDACQASRDHLVRANLGLVQTIARNYARLGGSMEELVERGTAGLQRAVDHFDPAHGVRFSTQASWWIKQEMRRVVAKGARPKRANGSAVEQQSTAHSSQHTEHN